MKAGLLLVLGIVLVVVLFLVGAIAGSYNNLVRLNAEVDKSWGQVENQLQRRNDLIPTWSRRSRASRRRSRRSSR